MRMTSTAIREMLRRIQEPSDICDTFIVYRRRYRFSMVRHPAPFNKTQRGKARRATRRFRIAEKLEHLTNG